MGLIYPISEICDFKLKYNIFMNVLESIVFQEILRYLDLLLYEYFWYSFERFMIVWQESIVFCHDLWVPHHDVDYFKKFNCQFTFKDFFSEIEAKS